MAPKQDKKRGSQEKAAPANPELRFEVGARVECNVGHWAAGTVVRQWYRDPHWPAEKVVPYQVKLDGGPTIFAPADSDKCIKKIAGILALGQMPVTVLTGFLGAGKTTLLNYILTVAHGKKYAVIENEFGAVAIDNQLLDAAVGKQDTVESVTVLDNGCLCCTVRDDLVTAIKEIVKKVEDRYNAGVKDALLDGILIETTGMADPGPIIKTFGMDEEVQKYCKIDGILTVVDCKHFLDQLHRERSEGAVNEAAQQVGFADKLLLNKVDACDRAHIEEVKAAIRGINTFVPITECQLAKKPDEVPLGQLLCIEAFDAAKLLTEQNSKKEVDLVVRMEEEAPAAAASSHGEGHSEGHDGHGEGHDPNCEEGHGEGHGESHGESHGDGGHSGGHGGGHGAGHGPGHGHGHGHKVASRHDTDVSSMVLESDKIINMQAFQHWLGGIIKERSVDLYRYKGVIAALSPGGKTVLYILQGVHDMPEVTFSGEWPENKPIKTQVVIIGRKLDRQGYRKGFEECFGEDADEGHHEGHSKP